MKMKIRNWLYRILYAHIMLHAAYIKEHNGMCAEECVYFAPWLGEVTIYTCNVMDHDTITFNLLHWIITIEVGEEHNIPITPIFTNQMPHYVRKEQLMYVSKEVIV